MENERIEIAPLDEETKRVVATVNRDEESPFSSFLYFDHFPRIVCRNYIFDKTLVVSTEKFKEATKKYGLKLKEGADTFNGKKVLLILKKEEDLFIPPQWLERLGDEEHLFDPDSTGSRTTSDVFGELPSIKREFRVGNQYRAINELAKQLGYAKIVDWYTSQITGPSIKWLGKAMWSGAVLEAYGGLLYPETEGVEPHQPTPELERLIQYYDNFIFRDKSHSLHSALIKSLRNKNQKPERRSK